MRGAALTVLSLRCQEQMIFLFFAILLEHIRRIVIRARGGMNRSRLENILEKAGMSFEKSCCIVFKC
ncbi:hypothetical protein DXH78_10705 [Undibacter mobilis]|uniref:Uncharacterized protein n=1 Tax=Undibacter mobilis TaxID=2292256 RepID=A0A371BBR0_9BRAD|nr:hypothetical protein DXH78_10705 [Undibacter mobilis]